MPLSNRALTWMGQLNDSDIGLEAPAISLPVGSFHRLAELRVTRRSIGSLRGFWLTSIVSNHTRAEVLLAVYSPNNPEIGSLISTIAEHAPYLRMFSAVFGCIVPFPIILNLRLPSLQRLTIRSPKLETDD